MNEPYRTQFEVRCAFNGFCKKVLRCEASNAWRDVRNRQLREISFSNLSPEEEAQLIKFRYMDNLSQAETAKRMGKNQVSVSRSERKILEKLRRKML